jgi:protein XagA
MHQNRLASKINKLICLTVYITLVSCLLVPTQAFSGAWTAKKGSMYNKVSGNFFISNENFDSDGDRVSSPNEFTDLNLTYYAEYGWKDNITVFGSIPYKRVEQDPDDPALSSESTTEFGDVDIGLRYKFSDSKKGVMSVQGLVKIPEFYDEDERVPVGNGQYDVEVRFLYGKSLYPRPMYYGLEFGYRFRTEDPSDEWKFLAEYGFNPNDKWALRAKLDVSISAKNGSGFNPNNPTLTNEFDLTRLELTVGRKLGERSWLEFSWTPPVAGEDTASGQTFTLAYVFQTGRK